MTGPDGQTFVEWTDDVAWVEDPDEPGVLRPDKPMVLRGGDSFTMTRTMIDGVAMPWAEGTVTNRIEGAHRREH